MRKNYFAILCIAAALVGCTESESGDGKGGDKSIGVITIDPLIETRATDAAFESGDKIGLTVVAADESLAENVAVSFDGTAFVSDVEWGSDAALKADIYAYYPYAETIGDFTVAADQSTAAAYTSSDLMGAVKSEVSPEASTMMTFKHLLSQIVVSIANNSDLDVESVKVSGTLPTATFDAEAMSVSAKGTDPVEITTLSCGEGVYKAIIVPQTASIVVEIALSNEAVETIEIESAEFVAGGEYTTEVVIGSDGSLFVEQEDSFLYHGETYKLVTLENGSKWMAESMRYVPEGKTPSSVATETAGVWNPYVLVDGVATSKDDAETIKQNGYFYDMETALGATITVENCAEFEGAQGICPDGWHIPTRMEYLGLLGYSNTNKFVGETAPVIDATALFYDVALNGGSIAKANAAGWNYVFSGTRMQGTFSAKPSFNALATKETTCDVAENVGKPAVSNYMTSTTFGPSYSSTTNELTNIAYCTVMSAFTTAYKGRLTLMSTSIKTAQVLRCVKDSE